LAEEEQTSHVVEAEEQRSFQEEEVVEELEVKRQGYHLDHRTLLVVVEEGLKVKEEELY
jgi:hypothetical protein